MTSRRSLRSLIPTVILAVGAVVIGGTLALQGLHSDERGSVGCVVSVTQKTKLSDAALEARFSRGNRLLFVQGENTNRDRGITDFKTGNYDAAIRFFQDAVGGSPNDPESQIYLNNAKARRYAKEQRSNPYQVAVVVPITNQADVAKEILRGVADAQRRFNQSNDTSARLLEILIVDDGNQPDVASQVACKLANDHSVLGVIGHNSSDASQAALPEYERAKLAMVSPTATSIFFKDKQSPVFFRTVPSDQVSAPLLASYAQQQNLDRVVLFYNSESTYSKSLTQAFTQAYERSRGQIVHNVDIAKKELEVRQELQVSVEQGAEALVLFPSSDTRSIAILVANTNAELGKKRLPLLGGDTLFHPDTLKEGAVENLVVIAPCWFDGTDYTKWAEERWKGRISWRTASSFDATQALIAVLKQQPDVTRQGIAEKLRQTQLRGQEAGEPLTSGETLQFEATGDRNSSPRLVQAVPGGARPDGAKFGFERID